MANSHGIVTQDAPTGLGTQDYTKAGLGTAVGAIMLGSEDTPVNTNFVDVQWYFGATDLAAANGVMVGNNYEDAQATSDVKTLMHSTRLLGFADAGTDVEDEGCNFDATITDGIRVDWTNVGSARLCSSILFKEGIDAFDSQLVVLAGTGSTTVTCGFNPDIIIAVSPGASSVSYGPNQFTGGVQFYKQTSDAYAGVFWSATHGDTTPDSARYYTAAALGGNIQSDGLLYNEYTVGNFTATGFDCTKVAQTTARVVLFICIKLASGYSAAVGTATAPVSTGVNSLISGLDHQPQLCLLSYSGQTGGEGGSDTGCNFSFGACDADAEVCMGGWIEDSGGAVQSTNAGGWHRNDSAIYMLETTGASVRSQAAFDSFQADGVDFNFTTANDALSIAYLTIGPTAAGSTEGGGSLARGIGEGIGRGIG